MLGKVNNNFTLFHHTRLETGGEEREEKGKGGGEVEEGGGEEVELKGGE